ncbi:MAG TPA: hypothetical protein VG756_10305 [Pseudonocardiaceae bacterium]|jgi:hypothetical protein|nr:hypothetical protein [Pseudonocardiaceae bacterium]
MTTPSSPRPPVPPIALHALAVLFAAVLSVLVASAWLPTGPDLSSAYSTVGTGLVGLVVNRHGSTLPWQRWLSRAWDVLVVLAIASSVATGVAMFVPGTNHAHAGAAFVAALAALAGLFLNTARLMPGI